MKVYGYQLSDEQIAAANKMLTQKRFRTFDVFQALRDAGVPYWDNEDQAPGFRNRVAERAADRLIQKARKAGEITLVRHGHWERKQ